MPLTNPYQNVSAFGQNQPASLPALPFEKPVSDLGKEAAQLHRAAQTAAARIRDVRDASADASRRLSVATAALKVEVIRGAREGVDQEREHELALEVAAADRLADATTHQLRQQVAVSAQREAVQAYNVFVWDHWTQLLDAEIRPEAEAASAELANALESIAPVRERYLAIQRRAYELARVAAHGEHAQHWATALRLAQEPAPPLPSAEAVEAFEQARKVAPAVLDAA